MWWFIAPVLVALILVMVGLIAIIHYVTKNVVVTKDDDDHNTNTPHQSLWH